MGISRRPPLRAPIACLMLPASGRRLICGEARGHGTRMLLRDPRPQQGQPVHRAVPRGLPSTILPGRSGGSAYPAGGATNSTLPTRCAHPARPTPPAAPNYPLLPACPHPHSPEPLNPRRGTPLSITHTLEMPSSSISHSPKCPDFRQSHSKCPHFRSDGMVRGVWPPVVVFVIAISSQT
jgi:hypothetical protein